MPELSVVIPTHNRRERLRACLASLAAQSAAAERFEVVVAVDGSEDGTVELLRALDTPFALRHVAQPQSGQAAALNAGAAEASAPLLLFLDDDMLADPGLVTAHLRAQGRGAVAAIGHIERRLPEGIDRFAQARARQWRAHYARLQERPPAARDCYSGNLSLPRAAFDAVGGFSADFPEELDIDFALRLVRHGLPFAYVPDAVATEDQREDWRQICGEAVRRGRIGVELYRRHPESLAQSRLGGHEALGRLDAVLRRLALALRVPPLAVALVGRALPRAAGERWFDFAYGLGYWRGVRSAVDRDLWRRLRRGLLILNYHAVGGPGEQASRFVVPAGRLAAQLRWLRRRGYRVLGLEEYLRCRRAFELPPAKSVVLTFDDGYRDNAELLAPLLAAAAVEATVFVVTHAGTANDWDGEGVLSGRPVLRLEEAGALESGSLRFGVHTRRHPHLPALGEEAARTEIAAAKADAEAALGRPVETFAYPYGEHDGGVRALVEAAGFGLACGLEPGRNRPATDPFALKRVEVYGTDGLLRFALTVWLGKRARWRR